MFNPDPIMFNKERATGLISIDYKLQISIDFHNVLNLVRDQGVGGSNPLSPTICCHRLTTCSMSSKIEHLVFAQGVDYGKPHKY